MSLGDYEIDLKTIYLKPFMPSARNPYQSEMQLQLMKAIAERLEHLAKIGEEMLWVMNGKP